MLGGDFATRREMMRDVHAGFADREYTAGARWNTLSPSMF